MSKIIGIDLGTTNSCVAVMEGNEPIVIANSEGKRTTPSVIGFVDGGERKVGDPAKRQAITNPTKTVYSIKRFMGETYDRLSGEIARVPYKVVKGDNNTPRVDIDGRLYTPQEISAIILQKMKKTAEDYLGQEVTEAVITVPAYFNDSQRQATKEAGEIAGLTVRRIVNEPTAAALAYGLDKSNKDMKIVVFDCGGGTHDVSVLPYIMPVNGVPAHLVKTLTRAKFEQLIDDLIQRTIAPCRTALQNAGLSTSDIDEIILVGGSTRIPAIQEAVQKFFGKAPSKGVNPDEVVAVGAAIQGGVLTGDVKDVLLLDVTPLSLGIETMGGVMTKMIEANTTIPTKKTETFTTAVDNQPSVEIKVLQGERPMAAQNKQIGIFHLDGIMPARRGEPQIEVTFDIDANGILNVSAKDKATGKEQKIRIEASSGLSEDEIKRMKAEAEANAEADKKAKEQVDKLNKADATIFQTEKQLAEFGDKIPADKKAPIEKALADLKAAYEKKDADACEAAGNTLMTAFQAASAEMYAAQQQAQQGAQGGTYNAGQDFNAGNAGQSGNGGKDAEDVDFEEVK